MDVLVMTDDPDLVGIPRMRSNIMVIVPPEMPGFKKDALDRNVIKELRATLADPGNIFLMHHLVTLQIKQPIPTAGGLCDIRLVRMLHAAGIFLEVPNRMDDANLVGT